MTALEICLVIIGIAAIIISYFISDKAYMERLKKAEENYVLSEDTKRSLKKQTQETVEAVLEDMTDGISEKAEIQLEKLSNEKIMAVHDYSDTVLNEINKNHNEVMFLYSMLDDKDKEIKETVHEVQNTIKTMKRINKQLGEPKEPVKIETGKEEKPKKAASAKTVKESVPKTKKKLQEIVDSEEIMLEKNSLEEEILEEDVLQEDVLQESVLQEDALHEDILQERVLQENVSETKVLKKESVSEKAVESKEKKEKSNTDLILELHREGKSAVDIAKELGLGTGQVRLVVDLHGKTREERNLSKDRRKE